MSTLTAFETLQIPQCGVCGVWHAIPMSFYNKARDNGKSWHCPNGHSLVFTETMQQKLEKELARQKHLTEQAQAEVDNQIRQVRIMESKCRALKGVNTRNRIKNGVCPCCKHPDYQKE